MITRFRERAEELAEKLGDLRRRLLSGLRDQFEREMRRSGQRVEDTVAPFARFVRAEKDKLETDHEKLTELEAHITGLKRQMDVTA